MIDIGKDSISFSRMPTATSVHHGGLAGPDCVTGHAVDDEPGQWREYEFPGAGFPSQPAASWKHQQLRGCLIDRKDKSRCAFRRGFEQVICNLCEIRDRLLRPAELHLCAQVFSVSHALSLAPTSS